MTCGLEDRTTGATHYLKGDADGQYLEAGYRLSPLVTKEQEYKFVGTEIEQGTERNTKKGKEPKNLRILLLYIILSHLDNC